jgi:hypothetical protein
MIAHAAFADANRGAAMIPASNNFFLNIPIMILSPCKTEVTQIQ